MKKLFFIYFIFLSTSILAQTGAVKAGVMGFYNPAVNNMGIGGSIQLEHQVGKKFSVSGAANYTIGEGSASGYHYFLKTRLVLPYKSSVISFCPEFRFYPQASMKGFFVGLGLNLGSFKSGHISGGNSVTDLLQLEVYNNFFMNPILTLGINLQITSNLCMEIGGGGGLILSEDDSEGIASPFNLRFGYSF